MAKLANIYEEDLDPNGVTSTIDLTVPYSKYFFTGTGDLTGAITITTSGTAIKGHILDMQFDLRFTADTGSITVLGNTLNTIFRGKTFSIEAYYNGSDWDVQLRPDFLDSQFIINNNIQGSTITGAKLASGTVAPSNLSTSANTNILVIECSFEANEQGNNAITMPVAGTLNRIDYEVIKALANTDAGTITPRIAGVAVTLSAPISIPLSTAINTTGSVNCTAANTFAADAVLTFVAAKTTAGGKVRLSIKYTQTS
jgi:hypothetical protein